MTPGKTIALAAMLVAVCGAARGAEPAKTGYHVTNKYTIGGDAGWDYIVVDPEDRRVYVTHHRSVEVLDADTGKVVGRITDMNGARGVALVKSIGKGFATNGKTDSVIVVDLKTLERVGEIKAGKKPDATIYDPGTDRVFVNNGDSDDMTVIDPKAGRVVGTIPTGDGFVTIVHQDSADKYTLLENVKTVRGAKTLGFDSKTGKLFSATVENVPPNATSQPAPLGKVAYAPGPFVVVEIGK
jgi:YVTN family beta-propeller protein